MSSLSHLPDTTEVINLEGEFNHVTLKAFLWLTTAIIYSYDKYSYRAPSFYLLGTIPWAEDTVV